MALKGNLLYNGDFETGTTEGWECGVFGYPCQCSLTASAEAKYKGNYGGLLTTQSDYAGAYLAYNKICAFEEYEAYLYMFYGKMVSGMCSLGMLYGLDDKGNLLDDFEIGYNDEVGIWRKYIVLLRGYRDITHFKVGLWYWGLNTGDKFYFDEAKLIPLKSIKSHEIKEYRDFLNVTTNKTWYSVIACIGSARLRSILQVTNVSGNSPTLDTKVEIYMLEGANIPFTITHSQFTSEGIEEERIDIPDVAFIKVTYTLGGDSPSFDIYHHLILEPNRDVGGGGLMVY